LGGPQSCLAAATIRKNPSMLLLGTELQSSSPQHSLLTQLPWLTVPVTQCIQCGHSIRPKDYPTFLIYFAI
jgi:hypothetical protein